MGLPSRSSFLLFDELDANALALVIGPEMIPSRGDHVVVDILVMAEVPGKVVGVK
ncbi:MAG TPA: hypothetical protein VFA09_26005 [Ktedonobacteraceae bacterium]|nr:hypothetical protein [Ktedonobacteraceae bacterium]